MFGIERDTNAATATRSARHQPGWPFSALASQLCAPRQHRAGREEGNTCRVLRPSGSVRRGRTIRPSHAGRNADMGGFHSGRRRRSGAAPVRCRSRATGRSRERACGRLHLPPNTGRALTACTPTRRLPVQIAAPRSSASSTAVTRCTSGRAFPTKRDGTASGSVTACRLRDVKPEYRRSDATGSRFVTSLRASSSVH